VFCSCETSTLHTSLCKPKSLNGCYAFTRKFGLCVILAYESDIMSNVKLTSVHIQRVILRPIRLLVTRPRVIMAVVFTSTLLVAGFQLYTNPKQAFTFVRRPSRAAPVRRDCVWNETTDIFSNWTLVQNSLSTVDGEAERLMFSTLPASSARLGNQMFGHAALLGIAHCTGYRPIVSHASVTSSMILATFSLTTQTVVRINKSSPVTRWTELNANVFTPPENLTQPGWLYNNCNYNLNHLYMCMYMYVCVCVCVCIYICLYVCIYVYILLYNQTLRHYLQIFAFTNMLLLRRPINITVCINTSLNFT